MTSTTAAPVDKIKRNAEIAAKSLHTYLTIVVSFGASILLALGPDWVTAFIQTHPALAAGAPFVSLAFVLLTQIAPQNITLASDKQKAVDAARAWVLDLAAKAMPGQPMAVPPAIAKAVGLPATLPAPLAKPVLPPAPSDPVDTVYDDLDHVLTPAPAIPPSPLSNAPVLDALRAAVAAEPAPPAFDLRMQFRTAFPQWTDAQVDAAVAQFPAMKQP